MKLLSRARTGTMQDRLVWQSASLLLAYPDERQVDRLQTVETMLDHITGPAGEPLARTVTALRSRDWLQAAAEYVETFDLRRRATMYLTYWTAGDTRNRGTQMLAFTQVYRNAGKTPPKDEAPDHLPVLLEFAATVDPDAGRRLLVEHRVPIDVLHEALVEADSAYADTVAAVCKTLPAATDQEVVRAQRLAQSGPPAESVGLQPFTLTVPPRSAQGGG